MLSKNELFDLMLKPINSNYFQDGAIILFIFLIFLYLFKYYSYRKDCLFYNIRIKSSLFFFKSLFNIILMESIIYSVFVFYSVFDYLN